MSATYPTEESEKSGIYPSLPTAPPMPPPYTPIDPAITVPTRAELEEELRKVEDEIATLRAVLASKQERVAQLKRDLGVYGLDVVKDDIRRTANSVAQSKAFTTVKGAVTKQWNNVTQTNAYKTVNNNVSNFVKSVKSSLNGKTTATPQPYSQPQAPPYYNSSA
nr:tumor protein d52 [Hymenolepis microstoma]